MKNLTMEQLATAHQNKLLDKCAIYASNLLIEKALALGWIKDEGLISRAMDYDKRKQYLVPLMLEIGRHLDERKDF